MKSFITFCSLLILSFAVMLTTSSAQEGWDYKMVSAPSVLMVENTYYLWYTGKSPEPFGSIGFASSTDGIAWDMHSGNPVLIPEPFDEWNEVTVIEPSVIMDGTLFRMWYTSYNNLQLLGPAHIHHATSEDGLVWTKDTLNNPVLSPGPAGSWDDQWIDSHCIIKLDTVYHLWYSGLGGNQVRIGHATSADGVNWIKDANNPVLSSGAPGSWDYSRVEAPSVIFDGATFHMWYMGGSYFEGQVGYATSGDGVNWTKHEGNPVLTTGTAGNWDDTAVGFCSVLLDTAASIYKMWYTGGDTNVRESVVGQIGYAISEDGVNWTKHGGNPVVTDIGDAISAELPEDILLFQNYPNPFNPVTMIDYQLPMTSDVELSIYNILGQKVASLVNERQQAGQHQVEWDARGFASGVYYYKLSTSNGFVKTKKCILFR
jgi:predicted GH43/DUF377 family glycosyl hydrolase